MKAVLAWAIALGLLGSAATGAVLLYRRGKAERDLEAAREKPIEPPSRSAQTREGEAALEFPPEERSRLGLRIVPLAERIERPECTAYGRVVNPAPLLGLQAELGSVQASLPASRTEFERMKTLFEEKGNASRRAFEAAQAQLQLDENRQRSLLRQLSSEWGDVMTTLAPSERDLAIEKLARHETALVRVALLPGTRLSARPRQARVGLLGEEAPVFTTSQIFDAPQADPRTPGQGFLLRLDGAGPALAPGAGVVAHLGVDGEPEKGVVIPSSAVVRFAGKSWVYLLVEGRLFVRREVVLERPVQGGWFSSSGPKAGIEILVEGTGTLLSEELKGQIHVEQ